MAFKMFGRVFCEKCGKQKGTSVDGGKSQGSCVCRDDKKDKPAIDKKELIFQK